MTMSLPNIVEAAKADLYTSRDELEQKYATSQVEHLLRLRDMVTWSIANPDAKDRQFVDEERTRYGLTNTLPGLFAAWKRWGYLSLIHI